MRVAGDAKHPIEPALAGRIVEHVTHAARPLMAEARSFAIVTSPLARRALSRLFRPHLPETPVMSFLEIPDGKPVEVAAVVGNEERIGPRKTFRGRRFGKISVMFGNAGTALGKCSFALSKTVF